MLRKYPPFRTREEIQKWCDKCERAHSEVLTKLYRWGVEKEEASSLLAELISGNYLNEERFAKAFAKDKSQINGWGWQKIKAALSSKGVSSKNLKSAKGEIADEVQR